MGLKKTIIVGYLYNSNGMAAWNIEVATALQSSGHDVVLIHSKEIILNKQYPFRTISFDIEKNFNFLSRIVFHITRIYNKRYGFAYQLDSHLRSLGIEPGLYLFNQSNLYDSRVLAPQFIKASTYPTTIKNYLKSYFLIADFKNSSVKNLINHFVEVIGWYFTDWYAYKNASGILCHTKSLSDELNTYGVKAYFLPPPILVNHEILNMELNDRPVFLTVALDLEDKRKRISWIIDNFLKSGVQGELRIVGSASEQFIAQYSNVKSRIKFLGKVPREEMKDIYAKADIFLFASNSDTWGYVLTEAMSHGLILIAPDLYPYDFIIGDKKYLYPLNDSLEFQRKIKMFSGNKASISDKEFFVNRAVNEFSHEGFAMKLLVII